MVVGLWTKEDNMKKILIGILILPFLSGCMFLNAWLIKGDGKKLGGNYGITSAEAGKIDVIGFRYLLITNQKIDKAFLQNLPTLKITVDNDNKAKSVSMGTSYNFTHK